jgi:hypothetical protein
MQKKQLARAALMVFAAAALLAAGYVAGTHRSAMSGETARAATASGDRTDPKTGGRYCTGTTRWCPTSISTSRASHLS